MRPTNLSISARVGGVMVLALACAASLVAAAPASALTIRHDHGGPVNDYLARWRAVAERGEQVTIDGMCASACTLVLAFISADRICVTSHAEFVFHAAWSCGADECGDIAVEPRMTDPVTTARMLASYPSAVRTWLVARGGLTEELLLLEGAELAAVVRTCRVAD